MDNLKRLENRMGFGDIFEMVKRAVERHTGLHRAGLTLLVGNLPSNIAAYYPVNSNYIVLNGFLARRIKTVTASELEFNSFVFVVLMHEYLHSLGFLDESDVRKRVNEIIADESGRESMAYEQATLNWLEKYPELDVPVREGNSFEIIRDFDYSSQPYI